VSALLTTDAPPSLEQALERIAARAPELDRSPRFPGENLGELREAGAMRRDAHRSLASQLALVRCVAAVDASTARILDGHLNAAERLALLEPRAALPAQELEAVCTGELLAGVWGADPVAGEGEPARIVEADGGLALQGVKVFCSGAGGLERALVVARDGEGVRRLAYIDATVGLRVDRAWYRGSGLRSSESHRVVFAGTPVLALLGGPDELLRQPYFARDAVRTAATWAGLCDTIEQLTTAALALSSAVDAHQDAALGRIRVHAQTVRLWLALAARRLELPDTDCAAAAQTGAARAAIAESAQVILASSAAAGGSRAMATIPALERARRDLELFLRQHRLEPALESLGRAARAATA
jgi:hypothetical protein